MEKNFLNDVTPPAQKRSIRDIPIPAARRGRKSSVTKIDHDTGQNEIDINLRKSREDVREDIFQPEINKESQPRTKAEKPKRRSGGGRKIFVGTVFVLILIFAGIAGIASLFDGAVVNLKPKTAEAEVNEEVLINNVDGGEIEGSLSYRNLNFSTEKSVEITATGEEQVSEKASGTITVFNEYSESSQKLIKNTRFEAPNGNIYRIQDSIEVPGYTEENGVIVPGSIDVTVYADEVGEGYNLGKVDFTIPGFEGQEQFDYFYAESVTEMTGGFDGIRKIISEEDKNTAITNLQSQLKDELIVTMVEQLPTNLRAIYGEESFSFSELEQESGNSEKVKATMTGGLTVKVVDKNDLAEKIAERNLSEYQNGQDIAITNLDELDIYIETREISEEETSEYLVVSGNIDFQWENNETKLAEELSGKHASELKNVLADFSGIESAQIKMSPFWKKTFPENPDKIRIEITLEN